MFESDEVSILSLLQQTPASDWRDERAEGQLAVDVSQTADEVIVVATMAGADPSRIELHLHNDLLTIRGWRDDPASDNAEHFFQECYWGGFSRTSVLPVDVKAEFARAEYKNGVLVVRLPKSGVKNEIPLFVVEE